MAVAKQHKNAIVVIFLVLFVAISSAVVISRAEPKVAVSKQPTEKLLIAYDEDKPGRVVNVNGKPEYESRGRSIEVTETGLIFCTPRDKGKVTFRSLSKEERDSVNAQVAKSNDAGLKTKQDKSGQAEVSSGQGVYVQNGSNELSASNTTKEATARYINSSNKLLESLCAGTSNVIEDVSIPTMVTKSSTTTTQTTTSLKELLVPKAFAGGTAPVAQPVLDTASENVQHTRLAAYRKQNGRLATTRNNCLDIWARNWAKQLATEKRSVPGLHSNLTTQYVNNCGTDDQFRVDWIAFGENVGYLDIPVTDAVSESERASNAIFQGFINSPTHNAGMLDGRWELHGIGSYKSADKTRLYVVQAFKQSSTYNIPVK